MPSRPIWMIAISIALASSGCATSTPTTSPSTSPTSTQSKTEAPVTTSPTTQKNLPPTDAEVASLTNLAKDSIVRITTKRGVIDLAFYPDDAPVHVANFLKLVQAGFYNGLTFHRVEPGFVIQGGDPSGNGTGGPGYSVKAEFNKQKHETGTLAMARSADPDSAGSQFYITLAPQPGLDNSYTVFGHVVSDLSVISQIQRGDVMDKVEILPKK